MLPNEWSPDTAHEALVRDVPMFKPKGERCNDCSVVRIVADLEA